MCLLTTSTALKCAFADIVCYKVLYPSQGAFYSPYKMMKYNVPSTVDDMEPFEGILDAVLVPPSIRMIIDYSRECNHGIHPYCKKIPVRGLSMIGRGVVHCFLDINEARAFKKKARYTDSPLVIVKCIIPKGSFVIPSFDMTEIGTTTLKLLEVIE